MCSGQVSGNDAAPWIERDGLNDREIEKFIKLPSCQGRGFTFTHDFPDKPGYAVLRRESSSYRMYPKESIIRRHYQQTKNQNKPIKRAHFFTDLPAVSDHRVTLTHIAVAKVERWVSHKYEDWKTTRYSQKIGSKMVDLFWTPFELAFELPLILLGEDKEYFSYKKAILSSCLHKELTFGEDVQSIVQTWEDRTNSYGTIRVDVGSVSESITYAPISSGQFTIDLGNVLSDIALLNFTDAMAKSAVARFTTESCAPSKSTKYEILEDIRDDNPSLQIKNLRCEVRATIDLTELKLQAASREKLRLEREREEAENRVSAKLAEERRVRLEAEARHRAEEEKRLRIEKALINLADERRAREEKAEEDRKQKLIESIRPYKDECEAIGFKKGSDRFAECVLELSK